MAVFGDNRFQNLNIHVLLYRRRRQPATPATPAYYNQPRRMNINVRNQPPGIP